MTLEINFYAGADAVTHMCYGAHVGVIPDWAITGTSSVSAIAIPAGAAIARVTAGEKCRFLKNVDNSNAGTMAATATTGQRLTAGESIDVAVTPGKYFNAITY